MNAGGINYCLASRASSVEPFLGNGPFNSVPSFNPYDSHINSPHGVYSTPDASIGTRCLGRIRLGRTICEEGDVTTEHFSRPTAMVVML